MDLIRLSLLRLRPCLSLLQRVNATGRNISRNSVPCVARIHTSGVHQHLMEFFDDKDNADRDKVDVGRPWRRDELRIKSNEDLHKLWYILLKERNMLMTMENMYEEDYLLFPSPERMEKVEESMENLLDVVKERDVAFDLLETGQTGQPKKYMTRNAVGLPYMRTATEHYKPRHANKTFQSMHPQYQKWMEKYLKCYEEKLRRGEDYSLAMFKKQREELLAEFPHLTEEDVEQLRPELHRLETFLNNSASMNDIEFTSDVIKKGSYKG